MVWEVDEDGDGYVSWDEYLSAYERAVADKAWIEPRKLSTEDQDAAMRPDGGSDHGRTRTGRLALATRTDTLE